MIWYPYEQMKTMKAPYKIIDAEGVYLYTEDISFSPENLAKLIELVEALFPAKYADTMCYFTVYATTA